MLSHLLGTGERHCEQNMPCFFYQHTAKIDICIYVQRRQQKVRTTEHGQVKLQWNCFLNELFLLK